LIWAFPSEGARAGFPLLSFCSWPLKKDNRCNP